MNQQAINDRNAHRVSPLKAAMDQLNAENQATTARLVSKAPALELRKVKYSPSLSEETYAFTAEIWMDGKKEGTASNHGHGGMTTIYPPALEDRLARIAAGLPKVDAGDFTYQPTADSMVDDLLGDWLLAREREKLAKKFRAERPVRLFWLTPAGEILQSKKCSAEVITRTVSDPVALARLKAANPNDRLLNLEPDGEALFVDAIARPVSKAVRLEGGRVGVTEARS